MKYTHILIIFLLFYYANPEKAFAQPGSNNLPEIRTEIYDSTALGKGGIFLSNYRELGLDFQGDPEYQASIMILNNDGIPLFSKNIGATKGTGLVDFKMHPNGMMSYPKVINNYLWTGGGEVIHMVMDRNFNIVDSFQMKNGYLAETHDFRILPNGNALLMAYYLVPIDMSKRIERGRPDAFVDGAVIQELDENKNVVFQWRSWDYLSFDMVPWEMVPGNTQKIMNVFHLNSISLDHDGNLLLGTPGMGIKVSRQSGDIMWIAGGFLNQFAFTNVDPMEGFGDFGGHTFHRLENGNIMVYDNSPFPWQPGANVISAEAVEYKLNEENKTAELIWKYTPPSFIPGWHAGSVQRLPNENTVIGWGGPPVDSTSLVFSEVTRDSTRVMDVFFEGDRVESYRAFRFPVDDGMPEKEVTKAEVAPGNTYDFNQGDTINTGISFKIDNYYGGGYNELTVKTYNYAPLNCQFPGKAPRVMSKRIVCEGYNLTNLEGQVRFDVDEWKIKDPEDAIIYFREFEGNGLFIPLETDYNYVTGQVRAYTNRLGEFIIAYPDLQSLIFTPGLLRPLDSALVNQEMPVLLNWNPKGYFNGFVLEIATDDDFTNIVFSDQSLTESLYSWSEFNNNTTYYWHVKAKNDAGISDWSETRSFETAKPYIDLISPNGDEVISRGLEHFIHWKGNNTDSVKLELYLNNELVTIIDTVAMDNPERMYYKWEFPTSLDSTCGYHIKITSTSDVSITDISDKTFAVNDSSCINSDVLYITVDSPLPGTVWTVGETYSITWNDNISEDVVIELMQGSNSILEITATAGNGSYEWTIPESIVPGSNYTLKISSSMNSSISTSSNIFEIDSNVSVKSIAGDYNLQIVPNPAINGTFNIHYFLIKSEPVQATLYNLSGEKIKILIRDVQDSGQYSSTYNLSSLPKGLYIIEISFGQHNIRRKLIIN